MTRAIRKAIRTALQLIASGGLTALVTAIAGGLSPYVSGIVLAVSAVLVTFVQNALEDARAVPTILPSPPPGTTDAPLVQPR